MACYLFYGWNGLHGSFYALAGHASGLPTGRAAGPARGHQSMEVCPLRLDILLTKEQVKTLTLEQCVHKDYR